MQFKINILIVLVAFLASSCLKLERLTQTETLAINNIKAQSAVAKGVVLDLSNDDHPLYGFCLAEQATPTVMDRVFDIGASPKRTEFTGLIDGLKDNTNYYLRSFVMDNDRPNYGKELAFKTLQIVLPSVSTNLISNISVSAATTGGNITKDGNAPIIARGVCWSKSPTPTLADNKTTETLSPENGNFTSNLSALEDGNTYYVIAYATNSAGTAYGNEISFTTVQITVPELTTQAVTDIAYTTATAKGTITKDGNAAITAKGVCWSKNPNPTLNDGFTNNGTGNRDFTSAVIGLSANTNYYLRAYATNSRGIGYGNELTFTTKAYTLPELTIAAISNITINSATGGGNVSFDGGMPITEQGICYSTSPAPTTANIKLLASGTSGAFICNLIGLLPNVTYYVRAYAVNSVGTAYGAEKSFTTLAALPTVTTSIVSNITATTASGGGNVTADGGTTISERGICYGTSQNPTIGSTKIIAIGTMGAFTANIAGGLAANTVYYVRAYASNSVGISYGTQESFTTLPNPPSVSTTAISAITQTTATGGGNVASANGETITERGICYGTSSSPSTANSKIIAAGTTGAFTCNLSALTFNTKYYVRAYAINAGGTAYGTEVNFTTLKNPPTVLTNAMSNITQTTATGGGNTTTDGGATITERGICYSTSQNPTIGNTKIIAIGTLGSYSCAMTGVIASTTYYVRAYATNSIGTSYGTQQNFTTLPNIPILTTTAISNVTQTTATGGGNVTNDGGGTITEKGICYGTTTNPTTANTKVISTATIGTFSSNLVGLTLNTTYYVRAYAVNAGGTAYGNEVIFTTYELNAISDIEGNLYNTVTIGTQTWMKENLKTTKYNDGTPIRNVTDNTTWITAGAAYCWYDNDASTYKNTYGALYNWYVVDLESNGNKNACPVGWHVPSDAEWTVLTNYLGGETVAGGKMKEAGTSHWLSPNTSADNSSGFSALPGGYRISSTGAFGNVGRFGKWWSSTAYDVSDAYYRYLYYLLYADAYRGSDGKQSGFSVRCIKGEPILLPSITTNTVSNMGQTSVTVGGNITSDGGATITKRGVCWSTTPNPTIADSKVIIAGTIGDFNVNLTGLITNTTYYVRVYAINSVGINYGTQESFTTFPLVANPVTDIDGNTYQTVIIGTQTWMKENLKTTKYNDGTSITNVTDNSAWKTAGAAYCWYNNDEITYKSTYGALYNWYAVDPANNGNKNVCPVGWRVPSDADWTDLTTYLGGEVAGGKMKEAGTSHWTSPNTSADNSSGFSALPSGYRNTDGSFNNIGFQGWWWSSTENFPINIIERRLDYNYSYVTRGHYDMMAGFSVRCLKN